MQIEFKQTNNAGILQLQGDLNVVKVDALRTRCKEWLEADTSLKNVVVDLNEVPMIDSAGLGILIALLKQVRERGGDLHLAGLQRRVKMVFEITRTQRIFNIFDTAEEALNAFEE